MDEETEMSWVSCANKKTENSKSKVGDLILIQTF